MTETSGPPTTSDELTTGAARCAKYGHVWRLLDVTHSHRRVIGLYLCDRCHVNGAEIATLKGKPQVIEE